MQRVISSGRSSILTPSAPSTSAAPDFEDSARLPCLATGTPAPATISAAQVETLYEPQGSPPVPTTSMASGGAATLVILSRMVEAAPVISSTVSPRTRSAIKSPPICEGVASPDIMRSKAPAASSRVSDWPAAALAISHLRSSLTAVSSMGSNPASRRTTFDATAARGIPPRGQIEEILQQQMAVLGGDALGMKLHAVHGPRLVRKPHDQAVIGFGGDAERVRKAIALDHQRMVARRLERAVDAAEHAFAAMAH